MKQIALEGFLKKHRDVSKTIATAKMELFVGLVSSFQPLTNFKKNPNIGAVGVLQVIKLGIAELYPEPFLKIIYFAG